MVPMQYIASAGTQPSYAIRDRDVPELAHFIVRSTSQNLTNEIKCHFLADCLLLQPTYEQNAIMINNNNNNDLAIRFVNTAMSTVSSYVICHVIASPSNYPPSLNLYKN